MSHDSPVVPPGQEQFIIGEFQPEDAAGIVRLFRAVYGELYPIRLFYDPAEIVRANGDGRYLSICARTPSGEVVGVNHLYPSAPCRSLYESGVGLVRKDYRSLGVNTRMLGYLNEEFIPRRPEIEEVFGEAVCNHPFMQKAIAPCRYVETALEVALMPAEAYVKEQSAGGRVATLAAFRCFRPKPHRIFLPLEYDAVLRQIYGRLDDSRELSPSVDRIPPGTASRMEMTMFAHARVARIAVFAVGDDFSARLAELEARGREKQAAVYQVWADLTTPWVGAAVRALREAGYFFGGALPRWFDGDGLLMQKLHCPPDFEGIVLESAFAKELLGIIREDWRRAEALSGG